jgi:membrane peptidoglycan carboxypeptidase
VGHTYDDEPRYGGDGYSDVPYDDGRYRAGDGGGYGGDGYGGGAYDDRDRRGDAAPRRGSRPGRDDRTTARRTPTAYGDGSASTEYVSRNRGDAALHSEDTRTVGRDMRPRFAENPAPGSAGRHGAPGPGGPRPGRRTSAGTGRGAGYDDPDATSAIDVGQRRATRGAGTGRTGAGGAGVPRDPSRGRRGPRWWRNRPRWLRRLVLASIAAFFLLIVAAIGVVYAATKVPLPDQVTAAQTSVITYSDGNQELAKIGTVNRTDVPLAAVSKPAQDAVLAAEDRNFYHEPGISYRGIARALYTDIRGGGISQGGSTITQQYAKNAYLTQQRTFSRKIKEIVLAVKLDKKYSKNQILEYYLNTIYFGRGSYGIQAAAKTYFGVNASQLTAEQGAVIAGLIRSPNYLDPRVSPRAANLRWHEVLDTMVRQGWLPASRAGASATMPVTLEKKSAASGALNPQASYIRDAVLKELNAHGITDDQINLDGLKVVTTLDLRRQTNSYFAVTQVLKTQVAAVPDLQTGLVAVEPGTGRILAWYGGSHYDKTDQVDNLRVAEVQPGSAFKPVVLATALNEGVSLKSYYNAPDTIADFQGKPLRNDEAHANFGFVDLVKATAESINTVYVPLAQQVGVNNMVAMAHKLGIPQNIEIHADPREALGADWVHARDLVSVYGTFASGGVQATPHLVDKVIDNHGHVIYSGDGKPNRVLTTDQASDVTYALQEVVKNGTGTAAALANGRPAAGKTGTVQDFRSAWFCGYTPQLASCVDMYRGDGSNKTALTGIPGVNGGVYGGGLPAMVWKAFMDGALSGTPAANFPPPAYGGTVNPLNASPTPSPTPSLTPTPTPTHSNRPSPSLTPSATATSTRSGKPFPHKTPTTNPTPTTDPIFGGSPGGGGIGNPGGNATG